MNPVPLLTRALEIGGARLFLVVASVIIIGAFLFFVVRGLVQYFDARSRQEKEYLDNKSKREEETTSRLLDMIQKSVEHQNAAADRQQTVNAKSIEALNKLLALEEAATLKLAQVDAKLTETVGWIHGRSS